MTGLPEEPPEEPAAENDANDPDRESVMWWNVCVGSERGSEDFGAWARS